MVTDSWKNSYSDQTVSGRRKEDYMNNEIMNICGVDCYEKDGTAYLRLESVARGLGFTTTQTVNGTEYVNVRWKRVDEYLSELNFATCGKRPDFIPENIFYRLAMKAKNATAEKFQALVADEIIPSIRKTGSYSVHKKPVFEYTGSASEMLSRFWSMDEQGQRNTIEFLKTYPRYAETTHFDKSDYDPEVKDSTPQPTVAASSDFKARAMEQAKLVCIKQGLGRHYKKGLSAIYKEMTKCGIDWGTIKHECMQVGITASSCLEQLNALPKYQKTFFEAAVRLQ